MPFTPSRPRQATTDSQGAFEFTRLPAGSYRITAFPSQFAAQYIGMSYGAKRPPSVDPGLPIDLTAGQTFERAIVQLPRGAVVTGRVTDDSGEPLARVQVYGLWFQPGSSRGQRNNSGTQTDDLGQFRLYGLQPGEYAIVAEARGPTFVSPNMELQAENEDDRNGFITTYYPGTSDEASAQRVRTSAAAETPGIEIRLVTGRMYRLSGFVNDSQGRPVARANGQVARRAPGSGYTSFGFQTDEQGRFQMRNIPSGNYRVIVRERMPVFNGDGTSPDAGELAIVPVSLVSADVEGLMIALTPGATVKGQIVFEQGPPASMPQQMRVSATFADPEGGGMGLPPVTGTVQSDLTFTLKGLVGEYLLRGLGGSGVYLKSISAGAEDITDTPHAFKDNERVTILLTTRASTVEGTVSDANGAAATDIAIILFSEDKVSWRSNSIRTRRAGVDQKGHFQITGLLPGRYHIIAAPRARLNTPFPDTSFFEALAKEALTIVVGEDEQRTVDLKPVSGGGGF